MSPASDFVRQAASDSVIGGGLGSDARNGQATVHDMPERVGWMPGTWVGRSLSVDRFPGPEAGASMRCARISRLTIPSQARSGDADP